MIYYNRVTVMDLTIVAAQIGLPKTNSHRH